LLPVPIKAGIDLSFNLLQRGAKLATFLQLFHDVEATHQLPSHKLQQNAKLSKTKVQQGKRGTSARR
jgi:hypothetical protein